MTTAAASAPRPRALPRINAIPLPRPELGVLLVLAAVLNLWALDANGWANEYYSAAVRSMSESWSAFIYGAFDSSGVMTVDKPPLALWVQALSVRDLRLPLAEHPRAAGADGHGDRRARVRPRAAPLRPPRRLRRRPRARAHADHGGDLAPQQPRRAPGPLLHRRAVGVRAGAGRRPDALARPDRRARRARLRGEDGGRADGRARDRRRVAVGRPARPRRRRPGARRGRRGDGRRRRRVAAADGAHARVRAAVDLRHGRQLDLVADPRLQRPRPADRPGRRPGRCAGRRRAGRWRRLRRRHRRAAAARREHRRAGRLVPRLRARRRDRRPRREPAAPRSTRARAG